jgi:hypothetical protein
MSIQATSSAMPRLCQTLLENPQEIANSYNCRGHLYKIAAIICAVALVAIFTGAMAIYLGMVAELPGWGVALALIAAMGAMKGLDLWGVGSEQFAEGVEYQAYADKYKEIGGWGEAEIQNFYVQEQLLVADRPIPFTVHQINALREKSPVEPLLALLPLIARYKVLAEKCIHLDQRYQENKQMAAHNYADGQVKMELEHTFFALQLSEDLAFTKIRQAIFLENLVYPTHECRLEETDRGIAVKDQLYDDPVGYVQKKAPLLRTLDYIAGRDPVFFKGEELSLSKQDIIDQHPNETRLQILKL